MGSLQDVRRSPFVARSHSNAKNMIDPIGVAGVPIIRLVRSCTVFPLLVLGVLPHLHFFVGYVGVHPDIPRRRKFINVVVWRGRMSPRNSFLNWPCCEAFGRVRNGHFVPAPFFDLRVEDVVGAVVFPSLGWRRS